MSSSEPPREIPLRISPQFMSDKLKSGSIDDRIDVYEDRMDGWFLRPIYSLMPTPNFRFAAISLALSYFEGWEQYRSGEDSRGKSQGFFIRGLRDVFPNV